MEMKPLGSITKYYPFLDEETQEVLDSLMASSYNYSDFVHQLVEKVSEDDSNDALIFLAAVHTDNLWPYSKTMNIPNLRSILVNG